jgi:oligoendopeptidase F
MKNNKEELTKQLKILEDEYETLLKLDLIASRKFDKESDLRARKIQKLGIKCYTFEDKIKNLDQEVLESKHSKKDIEAAKLLLEECGYKAIKI